MKKNKLKLYVWTDFDPDYTGGLAFAIAEDETDARKQIIDTESGKYAYNWGDLHIHELDEKTCYVVPGGA